MLSIADSDVKTPSPIVEAGIRKMNENFFIYTYEYDRMAKILSA